MERKNFNENQFIRVGGVGVIVKDVSGNIALVLENEEKPWKKPGQLSIVFETLEEKDSSLEDAVKRALNEELGVKLGEEKIWPLDTNLVVWVYDSKKGQVYEVELFLFEVLLSKEQVTQAKSFTNGEIKKVSFNSLEEILNGRLNLRPGTVESILGKKSAIWIKDGDYWENEEFN